MQCKKRCRRLQVRRVLRADECACGKSEKKVMHNVKDMSTWSIRTLRFMDGRVWREAEIEEGALRSHAQHARSPQESAQILSMKPEADLASRFTGDDLRGGSPIEEAADETPDGAGLGRAVALGDATEGRDHGRAS